jgi:hypothetical protein
VFNTYKKLAGYKLVTCTVLAPNVAVHAPVNRWSINKDVKAAVASNLTYYIKSCVAGLR